MDTYKHDTVQDGARCAIGFCATYACSIGQSVAIVSEDMGELERVWRKIAPTVVLNLDKVQRVAMFDANKVTVTDDDPKPSKFVPEPQT